MCKAVYKLSRKDASITFLFAQSTYGVIRCSGLEDQLLTTLQTLCVHIMLAVQQLA